MYLGRVLQYRSRIEIQVEDDISVKNAKMYPKGIDSEKMFKCKRLVKKCITRRCLYVCSLTPKIGVLLSCKIPLVQWLRLMNPDPCKNRNRG